MQEVKNWFEVQPGTPLKVSYGYWHELIADGQYVIHNSKQHGKVVRQPFHEVAKDNTIYVCDEVQVTDYEAAVRKARLAIGLAYDLWSQNCQHFVRWAHGLVPESPQVQQAIMITAGATITAASKSAVGRLPGLSMMAGAVLTPKGKSPVIYSLCSGLGALAIVLMLKNL